MKTMTLPSTEEMYRALCDRDAAYEGVFVAAIRTTGIFCRPTCPAKKPRRENVAFFTGASEAERAGFRPCLRCRPTEPAGRAPGWLRPLLAAVRAEPERRITDADVRALGLEPARVRRWFQEEHGQTFHAWQRARRVGAAFDRLRAGEDIAGAAYDHGFESVSGFRDAFAKLVGDPPGSARTRTRVAVARILSPLGPLVAGATDSGVCLLEFTDRRRLQTQIAVLRRRLDAAIVTADHPLLGDLEVQLGEYFAGRRQRFDLPLCTAGTPFQRAVWDRLLEVPYGATASYAEIAAAVDRPAAVRAVGRANGENRIAIVIPCHRVVGSDGKLVGYGGGLWRKRHLLELERAGLA